MNIQNKQLLRKLDAMRGFKFKPLMLVLLSCLCLMPSVKGGQLIWSLPYIAGHTLSNGISPIPDGTVFQLGRFTQGFDPGMNPQAQWASNWYAADFVFHEVVDPQTQGFGGDFIVEVSTAPLTTGTQLYVWGVHLKADGSSEQWLGMSATWQVPSSSPSAFPVFIDIDDASSIILGSANSINNTIKMAGVAASIPMPKINTQAWRNNFFSAFELANTTKGSWNGDPDADGVTNQWEYFLGTDPLVATLPPSLRITPQGTDYLLSCAAWNFSQSNVVFESSIDLQSPWLPLSAAYDFQSRSWFRTIVKNMPKNFYRMSIDLPVAP